jgi:hypothetical protein
VEGPAWKTVKTQGLLKENAKAALWILDPMAAGSTVDRLHNPKGYVIRAIHARSKGSRRLQVTGGDEHAGVWRRAAESSPARPCLAAQDEDVRSRALHEAGKHASKPRGLGEWRGHPWRPVPDGACRPRQRARGAA